MRGGKNHPVRACISEFFRYTGLRVANSFATKLSAISRQQSAVSVVLRVGRLTIHN